MTYTIAEHHDEDEDEDEDDDRPMFSLVTGQYRSAKRYGGEQTQPESIPGSSDVVLRNQDGTVAVMADSARGAFTPPDHVLQLTEKPSRTPAQFLQARSFRGLETRIGQDAPSVLEQGRSGIARSYEEDKQ